MTPPKLTRFRILFALLFLSLSGLQSPFAQASQAINYSTRMLVQQGNGVAILGFLIVNPSGAPKTVILRALGPSLPFSNYLADPVLELHTSGPVLTFTNNNWRDTQEAAIQATGIPPTNDLDSAILATLPPGGYTAILRGNGPNPPAGIGLIEIYDLDQSAGHLANLSTRAFVGTGTANDIVIAGMMLVPGGSSDRIVLRGLGPTLPFLPSPDLLADPTLEIFGVSLPNNPNDNWQQYPPQVPTLTTSGLDLAPTGPGSFESAIDTTLTPVIYTVGLTGVSNGTGIGLVELYISPFP